MLEGPADKLGDALSKYGRARCKLAIVRSPLPLSRLTADHQAQQEFGERLNENYIAGMGQYLSSSFIPPDPSRADL